MKKIITLAVLLITGFINAQIKDTTEPSYILKTDSFWTNGYFYANNTMRLSLPDVVSGKRFDTSIRCNYMMTVDESIIIYNEIEKRMKSDDYKASEFTFTNSKGEDLIVSFGKVMGFKLVGMAVITHLKEATIGNPSAIIYQGTLAASGQGYGLK